MPRFRIGYTTTGNGKCDKCQEGYEVGTLHITQQGLFYSHGKIYLSVGAEWDHHAVLRPTIHKCSTFLS